MQLLLILKKSVKYCFLKSLWRVEINPDMICVLSEDPFLRILLLHLRYMEERVFFFYGYL